MFAALAMLAVLPAQGTNLAVADAVITGESNAPTLSAYGFFLGSPDRPSPLLIPYTLATPLFSDYAEKRRYIYVPQGSRMHANADGLIEFPVGTALIKSFGYPQADGSYRTIETRLLLRRASGWVALPYIWRPDGSDADLRVAGARQMVDFADSAGNRYSISYAVPNRNQCKTCHELSGAVTPIGPKLRNMELAAPARALVTGADWTLASMPRWDDAGTGSLDARARAYLDVNCAHCHNPRGSASNSGLFLEYERPPSMTTGLFKRPVAAGRGSGGHDYAIAPGHPEHSILAYRMGSTDPGIAMPELGRAVVHREGLRLIDEWIAAMPAGTPPASEARP
ncbi:hypothetical protein GV829_13575 [Sphingomonas lacunae]|uniref:Cytochrome c domain-containing protein n=1 Tax=Sphingomonas lacunae TaxID=2698828 RepID=A0A6M4AYA1_9SPHN|nr:SO2930 family diheme c-type cytochrome [Sphingomonas lacunae]QJQ33340.1 hypothetical protein GV829_13575 [Sphingomonas lacunae]